MPEIKTINIPNDVAYHRNQIYQAVPFKVLFPDLDVNGNLQFTASDGFVATIPNKIFYGEAQAWLAIENPDQPWPALQPGKPGAGPFYLVWIDPGKSSVSNEQWPYQIVKIRLTESLEKRFPQLKPQASGGVQEQALRGLQVFTKNCASCHTLNHGGDAQIGPDLNLPMNPAEYLQEAIFKKFIRNPATVRTWSASKMKGLNEQSVSDTELDDLLVYLKQMARQRL